MNINELSINELERSLRATEQIVGHDGDGARILRRELERRAQPQIRGRLTSDDIAQLAQFAEGRP